MNEGLTNKEIKLFTDLVTKANFNQIVALKMHIDIKHGKRLKNGMV